MPKYSKKDFAKLCGIKTNNLCTYINRGKVICVNDVIDIDDETNLYFYEKRKAGAIEKHTELPDPEEIKLNERVAEKTGKETQAKFDYPVEDPPESKGTLSQSSHLDNKQKEEDLKKTRMQNELMQAKVEKIRGESIPTVLAKNMMLQHSKSITTAFKNGIESFLITIQKMKGLDLEEMATMRKELIEMINKGVTESIEESKLAIDMIVEDYSNQKDVGERA
jgi:hypothetical protein